jgi:heptosyltransferase-2
LHRLLVVKLADIGDVLTATPALRALRETYPAAGIDLLTTPAAAGAVPSTLVDEVLTAPRTLLASPADLRGLTRLLVRLRHARYDAVALLHHLTLASGVLKYRLLAAATAAPVVAGLDNGNGAWLTHRVPDGGFGVVHEVEYGLRVAAALGARSPDLGLAAQCTDADRAHAARLLACLSPGPRVAIHPGSGGYSLARRWEAVKWATVADALVEHAGAQVILLGTPADGADEVLKAMRHLAVDLSGRTSLPQLAALLGQCDLFLGADSGVMHLAAAMGVPVVALFGPSNHLAWGPWAPTRRSSVVRLGLRCSPCSYVGHRVGQRDGCWHRSCMADLQPALVLAAVQAIGVLEA